MVDRRIETKTARMRRTRYSGISADQRRFYIGSGRNSSGGDIVHRVHRTSGFSYGNGASRCIFQPLHQANGGKGRQCDLQTDGTWNETGLAWILSTPVQGTVGQVVVSAAELRPKGATPATSS